MPLINVTQRYVTYAAEVLDTPLKLVTIKSLKMSTAKEEKKLEKQFFWGVFFRGAIFMRRIFAKVEAG